MYAVIRAGGKQYRVAPGDVIRVETVIGSDSNSNVEFNDVLAISGGEGQIGKPQSEARVVGQVVEQGRGAKILVFHYKRKKQYKKLRGHRQNFTAVRITEIAYDGQKFTAPELPKKEPKPKKAEPVEIEAAAPKAEAKAHKAPAKKKAVAKKTEATKAASKKKK
jgi:large subunit ribosomal protein L21